MPLLILDKGYFKASLRAFLVINDLFETVTLIQNSAANYSQMLRMVGSKTEVNALGVAGLVQSCTAVMCYRTQETESGLCLSCGK